LLKAVWGKGKCTAREETGCWGGGSAARQRRVANTGLGEEGCSSFSPSFWRGWRNPAKPGLWGATGAVGAKMWVRGCAKGLMGSVAGRRACTEVQPHPRTPYPRTASYPAQKKSLFSQGKRRSTAVLGTLLVSYHVSPGAKTRGATTAGRVALGPGLRPRSCSGPKIDRRKPHHHPPWVCALDLLQGRFWAESWRGLGAHSHITSQEGPRNAPGLDERQSLHSAFLWRTAGKLPVFLSSDNPLTRSQPSSHAVSFCKVGNTVLQKKTFAHQKTPQTSPILH